MGFKTYPVLSPIMADRKYEEGDTIDLDDSQVDELTGYGAIGEAIGVAIVKTKLTAVEAIAMIKAAATVEEIDAILVDDKRATVVAAADARKAELAG
jgi:hypothetical protein